MWSKKNEELLNEQINKELYASYCYKNLYCYFSNIEIGYLNIANYFNKCSIEEQEHADSMIKYQLGRGGNIVFRDINASYFNNNSDKSDLYTAFYYVLELEKDVYNSLLRLISLSDQNIEFIDYITNSFLKEQLEDINKLSIIINKLNKIGDNQFGLIYFDDTFEEKKFII